MKNTPLSLSLLIAFVPFLSSAQMMVVEDRANTGQLKRMVHQQWDDWQPDPGTNFLGFPKDLEGFIYWRILHQRYYQGEDLRPYRSGGPFVQQYASLSQQELADRDIRDSAEAVSKTQLNTHLQMSGSELDLAYRLYFGQKFQSMCSQIESDRLLFATRYPQAYAALERSRSHQASTEALDILQDRITQVHEAYMDKGKRIEAYMSILQELDVLQRKISARMGQQALLAAFPSPQEAERQRKEITSRHRPDDAATVRRILTDF